MKIQYSIHGNGCEWCHPYFALPYTNWEHHCSSFSNAILLVMLISHCRMSMTFGDLFMMYGNWIFPNFHQFSLLCVCVWFCFFNLLVDKEVMRSPINLCSTALQHNLKECCHSSLFWLMPCTIMWITSGFLLVELVWDMVIYMVCIIHVKAKGLLPPLDKCTYECPKVCMYLQIQR